jgi:transcriptional regulator with XRE-family HTH domain
MGFKENLKLELTYNGMSVKELASMAGINKRAIDNYLRTEGAAMPAADSAVQIARALGVTVEYLVSGEEPAIPKDIRVIIRDLLKMGEKDRKVAAATVEALLERMSEG